MRELGTFGPQGFNDLALGLPGRISRSVLADRLRRLETLGLVSHRDGQDPHPAYHLTSVGQGLMRTLGSLRAWADTWLPDDPDMLERDPDILLGWLARRADPDRAPGRPVVLELRLYHRDDRRYWLVLQAGAAAYGCLTDPLLDASRYVYLEASPSALLAIAKGRTELVGRLQGWIRPGRWRPRPAAPRAYLVRVRLGPSTRVGGRVINRPSTVSEHSVPIHPRCTSTAEQRRPKPFAQTVLGRPRDVEPPTTAVHTGSVRTLR